MLVWLSAANVVVALLKTIHGKVDVRLICDYLIVLCVVQCALSLIIDSVPAVKHFVDSFIAGQGFMGKNETRLYGIGCSLDVGGTRFCAILLMCVYRLVGISDCQDDNYRYSIVDCLLTYIDASVFSQFHS